VTGLYLEHSVRASDLDISEVEAPMSDYLGAMARESWEDSPGPSLSRLKELSDAKSGPSGTYVNEFGIEQGAPIVDEVRRVTRPDAVARVKEAGLDKHVTLGEFEDIREPALDIMLQRGRERADRQSTIQRGPSGLVAGTLGFGTAFGVGLFDPLNVASAFIPVVGEANFARILATTGGKTSARMIKGAIEGGVGAAVLEPLTYLANTQEGQDYTMAHSLKTVAFGTALGGGLHVTVGAIGDRFGRSVATTPSGETYAAALRRGDEVFVGKPNEPHLSIAERNNLDVQAEIGSKDFLEDGFVGRDGKFLTRSEMAERNLPESSEDLPPRVDRRPRTTVDVIDRLPPETREHMTRIAIADLIEDRPVRAGEFAHAAARENPKVDAALRPQPVVITSGRLAPAVDEPIVDAPKAADFVSTPADEGRIVGLIETIDELQKGHGVAPSSSLLNFIKQSGGINIKDTMGGSDIRQILNGKRFPPGVINNKAGMSPDEMSMAAWEAGFIGQQGRNLLPSEGVTLNDLLDAMDMEMRGTRVFTPRDREIVDEFDAWAGDFERTMSEAGVSGPLKTPEEKRAAAMLILAYEREAQQAIVAYENAIDSSVRALKPANDMAAIDAGRAVENIPEPASIMPDKAPTKAEEEFRLAQERVVAYKDFGTMGEPEMTALKERWARIDEQAKDTSEVYRKGAACLNVKGVA
jgi:hypothetical protein